MTKYKEYFLKMVETNKELFDNFKNLHANYGMDDMRYQEEFNKEGEKILNIAHDWENKLCKHSETSGFGSYTTGLAEKFQAELRALFPLIDHVGIIVKPFNLKKIELN